MSKDPERGLKLSVTKQGKINEKTKTANRAMIEDVQIPNVHSASCNN